MVFKTTEEKLHDNDVATLKIKKQLENEDELLSGCNKSVAFAKEKQEEAALLLSAEREKLNEHKRRVKALQDNLDSLMKDRVSIQKKKAPKLDLDVLTPSEMKAELSIYNPVHLFELLKVKSRIIGIRKEANVVSGLTWETVFKGVPVEAVYCIINSILYDVSVSKMAFYTDKNSRELQKTIWHAGELLSETVYGQKYEDIPKEESIDLLNFNGFDEWNRMRTMIDFQKIESIVKSAAKCATVVELKEKRLQILAEAKEEVYYSYRKDAVWARLFKHREELTSLFENVDLEIPESVRDLIYIYEELVYGDDD